MLPRPRVECASVEAVIDACARVKPSGNNGSAAQKHLAVEAGYLAAIAHIALRQALPAIDALKMITYNPNSPTLDHAQALLGNVLFGEGQHEAAIPSREHGLHLIRP